MEQQSYPRTEFIDFLNSLPASDDLMEWINDFSDAFRNFLCEVDRITVHIHVHNGLYMCGQYPFVTRCGASIAPSDILLASMPRRESEYSDVTKQILQKLGERGVPVDCFQSPISFDYYDRNDNHFATLMLWNLNSSLPVRSETVEFIFRIHRFLTFVLGRAVAYANSIQSEALAMTKTLKEMQQSVGLEDADIAVVSRLMKGCSYKMIADELQVSIDMIRKRIRRIYRKTETHSFGELVAKYLMPVILCFSL